MNHISMISFQLSHDKKEAGRVSQKESNAIACSIVPAAAANTLAVILLSDFMENIKNCTGSEERILTTHCH